MKEYRYIGVRLPPSLYEQVKAKAAQEGVTLTILVKWALEAYVTPLTEEEVLIQRALLVARQAGHISHGLLQRKLLIGWAHSDRIIETLKERGFVVPMVKETEDATQS